MKQIDITTALRTAVRARRVLFWQATTIGILAIAVGSVFFDRYRIGINLQEEHCIPGTTIMIVDLARRDIERGGIYAFETPELLRPILPEGVGLAKRILGLPGDHYAVTRDGIFINGKRVGEGLPYAQRFERPEGFFHREGRVPDDRVWVMGDTPNSLDSRYIGTLPIESVVGRVEPVF
ncbi:MAG: signal peptidase I [Tistrella sp.]|mgnify:FL=1|uniref:signal peptidase I n=1 Tax=Tistrella sp. TaxID=2024861 RepID=UPI000C5CF777|nr:signal peptidase I [Tistrella sp.]MAD39219.1 signal peptidase I [Tistrella sp.]MBA76583.1 signal peptidase I [Tistrella sp.]MBA76637.1 signal peptidase I [Tistrella sp.]|tara:strand:- start:12700 stop:13236 length:537 start_codon:yes stop_codon:yes gene_type:complete